MQLLLVEEGPGNSLVGHFRLEYSYLFTLIYLFIYLILFKFLRNIIGKGSVLPSSVFTFEFEFTPVHTF